MGIGSESSKDYERKRYWLIPFYCLMTKIFGRFWIVIIFIYTKEMKGENRKHKLYDFDEEVDFDEFR